MDVYLIMPQFEQATICPPSRCPQPGCNGTSFRLHQRVVKPLRDTQYDCVAANRYQCLSCGHTFRVYPQGVSPAHTSQRVRHVAVLLYLLGLSYGTTARTMEALKLYLSKSQIYAAVQDVLPHLRCARRPIFYDLRTPLFGPRAVLVQCQGRTVGLDLMSEGERLVLVMHTRSRDEAECCRGAIAPVATQIGIRVVLAEDAAEVRTKLRTLGSVH